MEFALDKGFLCSLSEVFQIASTFEDVCTGSDHHFVLKVFKLSIIVRIQVAKFDRQRAERYYGASLIWKELKLEGV